MIDPTRKTITGITSLGWPVIQSRMAWALSGLSYIVRRRVTVPEAEPGIAKSCIQLCAVAEDRSCRNEMIEYLKAPLAPGVGGLISAILPKG